MPHFAQYICLKCDYMGRMQYVKRGSGKVELFAWMLFPLGIPYSLWRMLSKKPVCRYCKTEILIHPKSTLGQQYIERQETQLFDVSKQDSFGGREEGPSPKTEAVEILVNQQRKPTQDPEDW